MREMEHPSDALLLGRLDGELAEPERAAMEDHLADCPECRARLRAIEEASDAVAAYRESFFRAASAPARRLPVRMPLRTSVYALGGIAAAIAAVLLFMPARKPAAPRPAPLQVERPRAAVTPAPQPKLLAAAKRARRVTPPPALQRCVEFVPLPFSDDALPLSQAAVVRVEMPRSAMRLVGVPVEPDRWSERVRADDVFGADGLARAIRFIE